MERLVQCLSPVHIGTGRNVEPFDYILDGNRYIRVNLDALVARLSEEQAARLAEWVSERADRMAALDDNQQLSELRREFNLLSFARDHAVDLRQALLADEELALYKGRGAPDRSLQVREQLKEANGTPLIPGSSVKGAIRTALAFMALKEMPQPEQEAVMRQVEQVVIQAAGDRQRSRGKVPRRLQEQLGQEIEKVVFRCGKKNREGRVIYEDIHYDLMRIVSVSDCQEEQAELIVSQVYTFVKKRSQRGQREDELADQAPIIVEAHAPGNVFRMRINVDGRLLKAIHVRRRQEGDEWIGFEERVCRIFGSQVAGMLSTAGKEALERADGEQISDEEWLRRLEKAVMEHIETACREFARVLSEEETRWAKQFTDASKVLRFYERLKELGAGVAPLRLGWGSDFLSTTLLLALRKEAGWRGVLERCFRVFDIGLPPSRRPREGWTERAVNMDGFPTSRRLVAANRKPVAPFGWIVLASSMDRLPGPLVAVEEIMQASRTEERPADTGRRSPGPGGAGGRRPSFRAEVPPRRPEPPLKMPAMPKPQPRPEPQASGKPKVQRGDKVPAEVLSNEGGIIRVRLTGASGEEISFRAYYPHQAGAKVKVKVIKVTAAGKIMEVMPA